MGTEYQIESDVCNGRGFSHVDTDGICTKFKTWVQLAVAAGGPGWYILDDQSSTKQDPVAGDLTNNGLGNFTAANVVDDDVATKGFDVDSAGAADSLKIDYGAGVTHDLVKLRMYMDAAGSTSSWTVRYSDDDITYSNAETGLVPSIEGWNFFEWTSAGAHRYWELYLENSPGAGPDIMQIELYDDTGVTDPYIVVSDIQNPAPNERAMIVKVGYLASEAGYIRFQKYLAWDQTAHAGYGLWAGRLLKTLDDADFAYSFRGGPYGSDHRCLLMKARVSGVSKFVIIDEWVGNTDWVEADTVIGTLQSGVTAGSSVVLQLDTGEAALFTADNFYYIYDMDGHSWCEYIQCEGVDAGTDQITISKATYNYPAGAVIGAYPHRFYSAGVSGYNTNDLNASIQYSIDTVTHYPSIPYVSSVATGYAFHDQSGPIRCRLYAIFSTTVLTNSVPVSGDGARAIQKPFLFEYYRHNGSTSSEMNRGYGCLSNLYLFCSSGFSEDLDGVIVGSDNYMYIASGDSPFASGAAYGVLALDTEHAT